MQSGELVPGTVHLTNNLYVLDGVTCGGSPDSMVADEAYVGRIPSGP